MRFGVLGTGMVGKAIATKLIHLGNEVMMGSRSRENKEAVDWAAKNGNKASHGTFKDAAEFGDIIFNCTLGSASLNALRMAGEDSLAGKIVVDVSNPLDFSKTPPSLIVCNVDSLGEQVQRMLPASKVVKALNTVNCDVMVNPSILGGDSDLFICGNDDEAKRVVSKVLKDFGWNSIIDLGDIGGSRAMEMLMPMWLRLFASYKNPHFNYKIVKSK
jgi:predicted dinucleotide-binding enzyme